MNTLFEDWKANRPWPSGILAPLLAAICACMAFSAVASFTVVALNFARHVDNSSGFILRTALKGLFFTFATTASVYVFFRTSTHTPLLSLLTPSHRLHWLPCLFMVVLIAIVLFPRLAQYPAAAPDELHHLSVARNIAEYGRYASGHPLTGMTPFDNYDSVGPPVIVPVATYFYLAGISLPAGRTVMAVYYIACAVLLFLLLYPIFGTNAAATGVLFMTAGFGSIYLGRTLYGEAPGLAWVTAGVLCWRQALNRPHAIVWAIATGICLGFAVLCKTILTFTAFAFLAVWLYDRFTFKKIRLLHIITPGIATVFIILCWWIIKWTGQRGVLSTTEGTVLVYRHYLLFGISSLARIARWAIYEPSAFAALAGMVWVLPTLFRRRYDPALAVLWMVGIFYVYWWIFFTPGQLPRYAWTSISIGSLFTGVAIGQAITSACKQTKLKRAITLAFVFILLIPFVFRLSNETRYVFTRDDTWQELALAEYVKTIPLNQPIAAADWPVAGILNFLANRNTKVVSSPAEQCSEMILITDRERQTAPVGGTLVKRIGRFEVYRKQ